MKVREVMNRDLIAVAPETSLAAVAQLLQLHGISGVPVVDELGRPLGMVSKTDLLGGDAGGRSERGTGSYYRLWNGEIRALGDVSPGGWAPPGVVADVMTREVRSIESSADLGQAAERMRVEGVHRLLVVENGRLVGLVAAMDCLRGLAAAHD